VALNEVAPPGWGHTKAEKEKTKPDKPKSKIGGSAAAFKRALDDGRFKGLPGDKTKKEKTASMFKLMWSMKKKGDKPHYKPGTDEKKKKYQEEQLSVKDTKKLGKASILSQSEDPKDQERARARQTEIDYKDLMRQRKKGKVGVGKSMKQESVIVEKDLNARERRALPVGEGIEETVWSAYVLLHSNKLKKVEFTSPSNMRQDATQVAMAIFGAQEVRQLRRIGKRKGINEEKKTFKDFQLTLKTHDELNPKIWTDKKLNPEIATSLLKIGKEWAKFADIPDEFIEDYIIVGGNANFNYTKYSDIDLHLVVDKKKVGCEGCLDDFLRAKKQLWALTHNITIKGHPVELYAQDVDEKVGSKGIYSLNKKEWIQEPTLYKMDRKDPEVVKKVQDFIYQIDSLIDAKSDDKDAFEKLKDKIGTMRKSAIQKSGEYAPENLVFKELRNRGYVEKVWNYLRHLGDKELSVEETEIIDEKTDTWDRISLAKERSKEQDILTRKKARMKHGKVAGDPHSKIGRKTYDQWKKAADEAVERRKLKPGEVRKLVDGKWVSNKK